MKSYQHSLVVCLLLTSIVACRTASEKAENKASLKIKHISGSYHPPEFAENKRAEKIKSIEVEIHNLMQEHVKSRDLPGVAYGIVVDDQLIVSGAIGFLDIDSERPVSTKSVFRIASMTKSFTAMAIIKLRDEGKLSLDDPAEKYIPEMGNLEYLTSDSPLISIEHLLTMTAGLPEDNPWGDRQLNEPDQMLLDLISGGVSFSNPPSYTYEYSNTGYALLGNIISRVSGIPYQQYIKENILLPLGMTSTYWEFDDVPDNLLAIGYRWEDGQWKLEPMLHDGSYGAMGGLMTSIEDFSKYVSFHLSAWPPRSDVDMGPLKRSSLREMQQPQFARLYNEATDFFDEPCPLLSGYGYGLGITTDCSGLKQVRHGGALPGFGSSYLFYPDYGIGIMAFCNLTYTAAMPTDKIKHLLFHELDLQPRALPASDILIRRQNEIVELISQWPSELEERIMAENFYLDKSREKRKAEIKEVMENVGEIQSVGMLKPSNQLRGNFELIGEKDTANVYFTLSPEKDPKIQYLNVWKKN